MNLPPGTSTNREKVPAVGVDAVVVVAAAAAPTSAMPVRNQLPKLLPRQRNLPAPPEPRA